MTTVRSLLARDLQQKIEEVIKVEQTDEQAVYTEITEYIATERLRDEYARLFRAIAEAPADANEGIGVWISGFFGSGKSSFAKNVGFALANAKVLGQPASELLAHQISDPAVSALIASIVSRIPTDVIMFDVSSNSKVRSGETIAEIMYKMLLIHLGYAEDFDIAELEIELEAEEKLDEFVVRIQQTFGDDWNRVRKGAQKYARASAVLHDLYPSVYQTRDSWMQSIRDRSFDTTVGTIVNRAFDLSARRRPGHALVFIIDEVGQHVARSSDRIENLRAIVEQFGKESRNRLKRRQITAPCWVMVTSQEKLDEVVSATGLTRVDIAKLQDRFRYHIDLAPADIREVATRRVLAKHESAIPELRNLYRRSQGQLNAACRLERTSRHSEVEEEPFIQFYPYLPHFIDLSIDIMSGIRLQPGAPRHFGGSNRTIIKQAHEMLVSERTRMADMPIGALVTLDKIFELVEGTLSSEKQKDISDIQSRFSRDVHADIILKVAKTVALLEFVRDLPRTEHNIAACLIEAVGQPAPTDAVTAALQKLEAAQFVRQTDEGWKLQTAQEKNWETERGNFSPKQRDKDEILREALGEIFGEPALRSYRKNGHQFKVGVNVDGVQVLSDDQIPLQVRTAYEETAKSIQDAARNESRQNTKAVYWVFAQTSEIDGLIENFYASREMVRKYDQLGAQGRSNNEAAASLSDEKNRQARYRNNLRAKLREALEGGVGYFIGVGYDGSALGRRLEEIFKSLFDKAILDLYPKFDMGARPIKGSEVEEILKAANLNGLSAVFYDGDNGYGFVTREGQRTVFAEQADTLREVMNYLNREHEYGNRDTRTGRHLEMIFGGIGYGWEGDAVRLMLAVLFRAGKIDVQSEATRYDSYTDPRSREAFTNLPKFRKAVFTPRRPPDRKSLTKAVETLEALSGETADVETNDIAAKFRAFAGEEIALLQKLEYTARTHQLPVLSALESYRQALEGGLKSADDAVGLLAGDGASLQANQRRAREAQQALNDTTLNQIAFARRVLREVAPTLAARGIDVTEAQHALETLLGAETLVAHLEDVPALTTQIAEPYYAQYNQFHAERGTAYAAAIADIEGMTEWNAVAAEMKITLLAPLTRLAHIEATGGDGDLVCTTCHASLAQMESELAALETTKARVITRVYEIATPDKPVRRVRLADVFSEPIETEEAVERAVESLRDHLLKLIAQDVKIILE
ncbi:MAG: BREX system P-loop protein BrxC [Chloroflexi bacterium]|nr:BREX system P-loop protein BrxC [Chloroflexota bacterium]